MLGWVVTIYIFVHYFKIADHNKDQMGFVVLFNHILWIRCFTSCLILPQVFRIWVFYRTNWLLFLVLFFFICYHCLSTMYFSIRRGFTIISIFCMPSYVTKRMIGVVEKIKTIKSGKVKQWMDRPHSLKKFKFCD